MGTIIIDDYCSGLVNPVSAAIKVLVQRTDSAVLHRGRVAPELQFCQYALLRFRDQSKKSSAT